MKSVKTVEELRAELNRYHPARLVNIDASANAITIRSHEKDCACLGAIKLSGDYWSIPEESQEVVEMDYAEAEARVAAMRPLPIMPDCPAEFRVQGPCPTHEPESMEELAANLGITHEPVDYEDIDAQLDEVCARLKELFDDYRRQLGLPVKDKDEGEG